MHPRLSYPVFPLKKFTQHGFAPNAVINSPITDAVTKSSVIKGKGKAVPLQALGGLEGG
jgi:hypothetical protein